MDGAVQQGVSAAEAAARLSQFGPNSLPAAKGRQLTTIIADALQEPMFLLLLVAAVLYLVLGDLGEGAFLSFGACVSIGLVVFQEARSERALAALRSLAAPTARVVRDGLELRIPAHELVPGDLMLVAEGDRIAADARLVGGGVLIVDESTLTGESAPVVKRGGSNGQPLENQTLFAGASIVSGNGASVVFATGQSTRFGAIGASLAQLRDELTPLQAAARRLVRLLGVVAIAFCALLALAYGVLRGEWVEGFLVGLAAAIALIPEEIPMVMTVFLAIGAWRLARRNVLVRRSSVIEALGAATTLCVDKTGTLTWNRMTLNELWSPEGGTQRLNGVRSAENSALISLAAMACEPGSLDPIDQAIKSAAPGDGVWRGELFWPLTPQRLATIRRWRGNGDVLHVAKGAPEAIIGMCALDALQATSIRAAVEDLASRGLRVLGLARLAGGPTTGHEPPGVGYEFLGLLGFLDPVRSDVPTCVQIAHRAGLRVVMITGDHPATALAIARQAGLRVSEGVIEGRELERMSASELRQRLRRTNVFARVRPQQKLAIVRALQADGELVAMTGDGVNDAPALKAATIGIAMGRRGVPVARAAADLILLDDRFASIVGGVRLGRRIFANLQQALIFITAVHVPIAGLAISPVLLGLPPCLLPMHVVLLELVIDPIASLVFEGRRSAADAMTKPPRRPEEGLFGRRQIATALLKGGAIFATVMTVYLALLDRGTPPDVARAAAFVTLASGNVSLAFGGVASWRSLQSASVGLLLVIALALASALTAAMVWPPLQDIFEMSAPSASVLALCFGLGVLSGQTRVFSAGPLAAPQALRAWRSRG